MHNTYSRSIERPKIKLKEENLHEGQGDWPDRAHSDQMILGTVKLRDWTVWMMAMGTQNLAKLKGGYQAQVHSDKMVLVMARRRLDHISGDRKCSN
jgi:hypothetical protein